MEQLNKDLTPHIIHTRLSMEEAFGPSPTRHKVINELIPVEIIHRNDFYSIISYESDGCEQHRAVENTAIIWSLPQ